jgi:hypothetical protein
LASAVYLEGTSVPEPLSVNISYMETIDKEDLPPVFKSERLLPRRFKAGYTLNQQDMGELQNLLGYHYRWLAVYEAMRAEKDREIESLAIYAHKALTSLRAPVTGYVLQSGSSKGLYADSWVAPKVELKLTPLREITRLNVRGWKPETQGGGREIRISVSGQVCATQTVEDGEFEIAVPWREELVSEFTLKLEAAFTFTPARTEVDSDRREISYILSEIRAEHGEDIPERNKAD